MVLIYLFFLFLCQIFSVQSDGINLPITSLAYKSSPTDQKTLSVSFSPNVCTETSTLYIPTGARLTESGNTPSAVPQGSYTVQELLQPADLTNAPKLPFKTVSISTPQATLIDPHLQTVEAPLQIQSFNPNIAITPQISTFPQINLSHLENCDLVRGNAVSNDCIQKANPPVAQPIPCYFVTKDNYNDNSKIPVTTIMPDNLPSNICKMKVGDSKPIFIDCSKPKSEHKTPIVLTSVNPIELRNLEKPETPHKFQAVPNLTINIPNQMIEDFVIPQASPIKVLEDPITPSIPTNIPTNEKCIKVSSANNAQTTNVENPTSTGKILYPISNVKFNYGSNICNPIQKACTEKTQHCSVTPPKLVPTENKVGLVVTPVVNIVDNTPKSTQCNVKPPDKVNCNCNNALPKPESVYSYSPTSYMLTQPYAPQMKSPILPISQLPKVNTINSNTPMLYPTLAPMSTIQSLETTPDTFASRLSCSLNSIISLLTAGLLSKIFNTPSQEKSIADIKPIETSCDVISFKEPVIDVLPFINTETSNVLNPFLTTCSLPLEYLPISPNPKLGIELEEPDSQGETTISTVLCTENAPKRKPYIASVTINIIPNTEPSNDIIIIV